MHNVFANMWQIAAKSGMNKSIARFPDVCLSPPSPPAGPIPVPYPDTTMSTDLKKGSKKVTIKKKPVCLAQKSHYKASVLGNEAATRSFGASVVTHQITGKTVFQAWSMDVKFEGKNVCRHIDITTSNHQCPPPATPPLPTVEMQNLAVTDGSKAVEVGKCPCCGSALHEWQKDTNGNAFPAVSEEQFWTNRIAATNPKAHKGLNKKKDLLLAAKAAERRKMAAYKLDPANNPQPCLNVSEEDGKGCGTYLDVPNGAQSNYFSENDQVVKSAAVGSVQKRAFDDGAKRAVENAWVNAQQGNTRQAYADVLADEEAKKNQKLNHRTPGMAGGCNSPNNVVPSHFMKPKECNNIEAWQSALEKT